MDNRIVTDEEMMAFSMVLSCLRDDVTLSRVAYRQEGDYLAVVVTGAPNNYICRFDFLGDGKYVDLAYGSEDEERVELPTLSHLNHYRRALIEAAQMYL